MIGRFHQDASSLFPLVISIFLLRYPFAAITALSVVAACFLLVLPLFHQPAPGKPRCLLFVFLAFSIHLFRITFGFVLNFS